MDPVGLSRAARYSYPPNSLALCGPQNQTDLSWYAQTGKTDTGTADILGKFSTLYPYLCLIAGENHLKDPFDRRVIEAYWLGNDLLKNVSSTSLIRHLDETVDLHHKQSRLENETLARKVAGGGLPHHAFHVMNVYIRTGHLDIPHTVETMDACIINCGRIVRLEGRHALVQTRPLRRTGDTIAFGSPMHRLLKAEGPKDTLFPRLAPGDWVSYHWGYICEKISAVQRRNLAKLTDQAVHLANLHI